MSDTQKIRATYKEVMKDMGIEKPDHPFDTVEEYQEYMHGMIDEDEKDQEDSFYEEYKENVERCVSDATTRNVARRSELFPECTYFPKEGEQGHLYVMLLSEKYINRRADVEFYLPQDPDEDTLATFKIGISTQLFNRMSYYDPFTRLMYAWCCPHGLREFEREVKTALHAHADMKNQKKTTASEYFLGDYTETYKIISELYTKKYFDE